MEAQRHLMEDKAFSFVGMRGCLWFILHDTTSLRRWRKVARFGGMEGDGPGLRQSIKLHFGRRLIGFLWNCMCMSE